MGRSREKVAEMESAKLPSDAVRYVWPNGASSGFRDWAAECTGNAHEVCEMALAHVIGNKVRGSLPAR